MQGENFRPHKVEALVDDMMAVFLADISYIEEHEFAAVKLTILNEVTSFTSSLRDVSSRYYESIEDELLTPNEKSFAEIMKGISQKSLQVFAKKFLVKESRRITIELFAKKLSEDERDFKLLPSFNLNQKQYRVSGLEELVARKN